MTPWARRTGFPQVDWWPNDAPQGPYNNSLQTWLVPLPRKDENVRNNYLRHVGKENHWLNIYKTSMEKSLFQPTFAGRYRCPAAFEDTDSAPLDLLLEDLGAQKRRLTAFKDEKYCVLKWLNESGEQFQLDFIYTFRPYSIQLRRKVWTYKWCNISPSSGVHDENGRVASRVEGLVRI